MSFEEIKKTLKLMNLNIKELFLEHRKTTHTHIVIPYIFFKTLNLKSN